MSRMVISGGGYLVTAVDASDVFIPEDFSNEQKQIADTTEQFIINEVLPCMAEIDNQNFELVLKLLHICGELGLFLIDVPEKNGGLELDKTTSIMVAEKMGAVGAFNTSFMGQTGIGILPLVYYGTETQNEKYLTKLMTGEWIGAYCLTEPGSGSDALGAKASATLSEDGKYYVLNGTKQFITNAAFADIFTVFAKVDNVKFTAFLVERSFSGVTIGTEEKKLGIKGSSTCQVILDNVCVPIENLLGDIGKGHKIAFNVLNIGRLKVGAAAVGAAKYAFGIGARYANERKQFGKSISSFGAIKEKLADMTANIFAAESMIYRIAGMIDSMLATINKGSEKYSEEYQKGIEEYAAECAIAKVFCSEVFEQVADEVLQIHGGYGFVCDYPAERFYRDERIGRIYEGTNEINRILLSGILLRKGIIGEQSLQSDEKKPFKSHEAHDPKIFNIPFIREKTLLSDLKKQYLLLSATAVQKFGNTLQNEQEILMAIADVAIQIFALECALLRAEKIFGFASDVKKRNLEAVVKACAFNALTNTVSAALKADFYLTDENTLFEAQDRKQFIAEYNLNGILNEKRRLADSVSELERYIF